MTVIKVFKNPTTKMVYIGTTAFGPSEDFLASQNGNLITISRPNTEITVVSRANFALFRDGNDNSFANASLLMTYLNGIFTTDTYVTDTELATEISEKLDPSNPGSPLADVATSGDYSDLSGTPTIPDVADYETTTQLNNRDTTNRNRANHTGTQPASTVTGLSSVATSGAYNDLTGVPTTFAPAAHTHTKSEITDFNDADYATTVQGVKADTASQPGDNLSTFTNDLNLQDAAQVQAIVNTAIADAIDGAPGALDTLNELAAALGDDPNFSTTITNALALKANSADVFTQAQVNNLVNVKANIADVYTQTAIDNLLAAKADASTVYTQAQVDTLLGSKADQSSISNIDNTSDLDKPVSTATQTALNLKENSLGNPTSDGQILSSTVAGVRSWIDPPSGGGTDATAVAAIAAGSTLGLQQELLANAGQPGLTVLAVGYTTSGKVQGVSLGDGNVVEVYANGTAFNAGTVLYREFMSGGEPICFTGLSNGAIITSTQGFYGFSEQVDAGDESPMPLLSYGLSFKSTFFFGFRNCNIYNPGGTGANQGWIHIVNGPIASTVALKFGTGLVVQGQENIELAPWEYRRLYTDGNTEYIIESTNNVMACHNANMDLQPQGRFYDSRLIMPLTNDGITWPRSGFISAPFNNTQVDFWVRDGAEGRINSTAGTGVSPGSPVDFDAAIGVGTGATDADYEPNGATRVKAIGLISAYSGADSAGLEASPLMPTSAMSQVVAQPLFIDDNGDGGSSGIAIASPFEGTARVYEWDEVAGVEVLKYTIPLTRSGVTVTTQDDQNHPAAGGVANEATTYPVQLVGDLKPGRIIADVPITVVVQNGTDTQGPNNTIRSQNGTTTTGIIDNDDETLSLGITPSDIAVEIRQDANGVFRKRVIDASGVETWVVA